MSLADTSSPSSAVLQSGAGNRWCGEGLGAGVGGEAGAEGRLLYGIVEAMGLFGVRIGRGLERLWRMLLRRCRREGDEKEGGGGLAVDKA